MDGRQPARNIVPGALAALVGWMVVSAAFSFYVENFANYTAIYGALGTVIVLMMWLNLTALMLIMGAEINGVLISIRGRRTPRAPPSSPPGPPAPRERCSGPAAARPGRRRTAAPPPRT